MTGPGILVVCTGNLCRSPLAALLLDAGLRRLGASTPVASAGTGAVVGAPINPEEGEIARRFGLDPSGHRARAVDPDEVRASVVVLTAARGHRRELVAATPDAVRRVFTLREFERLIGGVGRGDHAHGSERDLDARLPELVELAAARRGLVPAASPHADDIDDPIGRPPDVHERVADELAASVGSVLASLARFAGRPAA